MLNKIILMGRLTHDPELRRTQNGTAVTGFSLAVERDFKDEDGKRATDFIDIVAWRAAAEFVAKYFTKGRMAVVEGRLQIHDWKDKDGNNRHSAEVVADNIYFGDSRKDTAAPAEPLPEELEAPITAGQKLGTLELKKGDISYATVDLLASSAVEADRFMTFRHNTVLFFQKPAVKIIAIVLAVLLVVLLLLRLTGLSRRRRYGRSARGYSSGYRGRRRR